MSMTLKKLTLELLRRCPNRCLHCSSVSAPKAEDVLPFNEVLRLIREAHRLGTQTVVLSGGEPLLYPQLLDVVSTVVAHGMECVVYTSGSALDDAGSPIPVSLDAVRHLRRRLVSRFNLTVVSHIAEVHDAFMDAPGSWARAVCFLDAAVAFGVPVHIHCPLTRLNARHVSALARFADSRSVRALRLLRLVPQGRAIDHLPLLEPQESDWIAIRSQIEEVQSDLRHRFEIRFGAHLEGRLGFIGDECSLDTPKLLIEPDGRCAACPALKGARQALSAPAIWGHSLLGIVDSRWRESMATLKITSGFGTCAGQVVHRSAAPLVTQEIREDSQ